MKNIFKDAYNIYKRISNTVILSVKTIKYLTPPTYGITAQKRNPKIVVSLTSFKERINEIHLTINSLLNQDFKPDVIVLWLSEEEFKNREKDLPISLLNLKKYGLSIKFCEKNIKSYKKLIPSLNQYSNDVIVLADDDLFYKKNWLELLYKSHLKTPNAICCHRAHRICFDKNNKILPYKHWEKSVTNQINNEVYLATSGAGVLFKSSENIFHNDILNENLFLKLAPDADDLWIWAMSILNRTELKIVENNITELLYVNPAREYGLISQKTLWQNNILENDRQLEAILKYYPKISNIIAEKRKLKCPK